MSNIFNLNDRQLIEKFVQGSSQLLASPNLRLEVNGAVSQLMSHAGEAIAIMYLQSKPCTTIIKRNSPFVETISELLIDRDFVPFGDSIRAGFLEYKQYVTPAGYRIWHTDPSILWKKWWPTERFQDKQRFNMDILVNFKDNWYPVQNISVSAGTFTIKTIAGQLILKRDHKVLWLSQIMHEQTSTPVEKIKSTAIPVEAQSTQTAGCYVQSSSTDLAKKIHQKQSELSTEQVRKIIKELEQKLQAQIELTTESTEKCMRAEHRALVAEQRLQIVYKHLAKIGINPQDIYRANIIVDN